MVKAAIHGLLRSVGYKLSRIQQRPPELFPVVDPLTHNSRETMDAFYRCDAALESYLSEERLGLMRDIAGTALHGVSTLADKRVADVGCGTGHLLQLLVSTYGATMCDGFDFSEAALVVARRVCPAASFSQHDIYRTLPDLYDVIFCTEVLEHLEYPEKALVVLTSSLRPGGILVLTVPNGRKDNYLGHIHFWSPESWRLFLSAHFEGAAIETRVLLNDRFNVAVLHAGHG